MSPGELLEANAVNAATVSVLMRDRAYANLPRETAPSVWLCADRHIPGYSSGEKESLGGFLQGVLSVIACLRQLSMR
jgi:hypothetical protein